MSQHRSNSAKKLVVNQQAYTPRKKPDTSPKDYQLSSRKPEPGENTSNHLGKNNNPMNADLLTGNENAADRLKLSPRRY